MSKNLINPGDSVVFAQHYLPEEPLEKLYGKSGIVLSVKEEYAFVDFDDLGKVMKILRADLEHLGADDIDTLELRDNHELGGMSKSQLIAHKLSAQETDPELNSQITQLLNIKY
jgi:hypothetical protein